MRRRILILIPLLLALLACKKFAQEIEKASGGSDPSPAPVVTTTQPIPTPTGASPLGAAATGKWKLFTSTEGRFSVQLPGTPTASNDSTPTAVGKIELHLFTVTGDKGSAWIANYSDYPAALTKLSNPNKILDGAMNGAVKGVSGTLKSKKTITVNGFPGREFEASAQQGLSFSGRIVLAENRMYQLTAVSVPGTIPKSDVVKFFNSLTITKP